MTKSSLKLVTCCPVGTPTMARDSANYLLEGQSAEYHWQNTAAWKPFYRSEVINIPDSIFEQYNCLETAF